MPRMVCRVVCGLLEVIATFPPTSALVSVDLPAFGRPTRQANPLRKGSSRSSVGAPAPSSPLITHLRRGRLRQGAVAGPPGGGALVLPGAGAVVGAVLGGLLLLGRAPPHQHGRDPAAATGEPLGGQLQAL